MPAQSMVPSSVGSVFNALNPSMAAQRDAATPATVLENVDPPTYGILEILNESNWIPKKANSTPPSCTSGMGTVVSVQMALAYNGSEHARLKGRWMVVSTSGEVVMLTGIKPEDRPTDPAAFPACVTGGLTASQATSIRDKANGLRFEVARVPRNWSIVIRPTNLVGVRDAMTGGDV